MVHMNIKQWILQERQLKTENNHDIVISVSGHYVSNSLLILVVDNHYFAVLVYL